jgi:ADP-ribose pyrophosphatase YjhB (NUDIX family)
MITCFFENNNRALGGLRHVTVNVMIIHEGEILLGKRGTAHGKAMLESGKWGLIGGFFDRDETLTQAVQREVYEESGCEITNIRLFRINDNPNRPKEDRQNVDIIFTAHLLKQTDRPNEEVTHLEWISLDNLPPMDEMAFDHGDNVVLYKKYLKEPFPLPLLG